MLATVGLLPGSALAATPRPGHYSGTTSQGKAIAFEVKKKGEKRKAGKVEYAVEAPCESGPAVVAGGLVPPLAKVSEKGKFSLNLSLNFTVEVGGKFTSKTNATGRLRYTILTGSNGYCDSGWVSWKARRS